MVKKVKTLHEFPRASITDLAIAMSGPAVNRQHCFPPGELVEQTEFYKIKWKLLVKYFFNDIS